jgi:hypothetical protein
MAESSSSTGWSPIPVCAYLVIGYLCGTWLSEFITPDFTHTMWTNIWVYFWIVLWPIGLMIRFTLWFGWWFVFVCIVAALFTFLFWTVIGSLDWFDDIRKRRLERKLLRQRMKRNS